jgi:hypothetical protein
VRSAVALHEPVIEVGLTVGCTPPVARRFTFLADPPAAAPSAPAGAAPLRADSAGAIRDQPGSTPTAPAARGPGAPAAEARRPSAAAPPSAQAVAPASAVAAAASRTATGGHGAARDHPDGGSRGRLPPDEPPVARQAAAVAAARQDAALAEAARVASAAQAAASAAQTQLAAMQAGLQTLHAAAASDRQSIVQLREQLARAEALGPWQPPGWALAAGLAVSVAGLGWRLRRPARAPAARSRPPRTGPPAPPAATATGDTGPVDARAAASGPPPAALVGSEALHEPAPLWQHVPAAADPARGAGGVDALIDLEQQVEFFAALGDDPSAVDLLLEHLRGPGASSPLPHLKLLEIHRRRGDHAACARVRGRFRQRFDADVPDGGAGVDDGRGLLDLPPVLDALQRAWPAPIEAMALLEDLLLRPDRGAVHGLAAYRDALLLYGVARDGMRRAGAAAAPVDVLLPLASGTDPDAETPYITASLPSRALRLLPGPTPPVDLDLSRLADAGGPGAMPAAPPGPA